jgi:lipopolysaccharide transport system permease protein
MNTRDEFDTIIKPSNSWFDFNFRELFKYRDLLFLFVKRDFVVTHAQSLLGPLWYFLTPLISTLVFVVVFGKIAQVPTDGLPHTLFYLSGLTLWNYFGGCTGKIQDVLYLNSGIFGRIYFPRIIVPVSYLFS